VPARDIEIGQAQGIAPTAFQTGFINFDAFALLNIS